MKFTLSLCLFFLISCTKTDQQKINDSDLKFETKVIFFENDYKTARTPPPLDSFYLWFPFIGGDLIGTPTTNDFIKPNLNDNYSFYIDFNKTLNEVASSTQIAHFKDHNIVASPAELKIARVATFTLDSKTNKRVGFTAWLDNTTKENLILVYFDRPGSIVGNNLDGDHEYRYNVNVQNSGYFWLRFKAISKNVSEIVLSYKPKDLVISVTPLTTKTN